MHIIQIQTIDVWKGAQERSGNPCSCYLVHSYAFYKEWADISRKCVAIVNHKCVVCWVNNYTKMKCMLGKHDAWRGAMVWPYRALIKIWEGLAYVVMHALHKSNHHRGSSMLSKGKSSRLKGIQIFFVLCPGVFFYDEHTPCKSPCSNLALFRVHLPYLGDYVHFLGINAHNSSSNNRCMEGPTRTS